MEHAARRPFRLDDRFVGAARRQLGGIEEAVVAHWGDPQPGRVPRHVRVVPFQPCEHRTVRRQARCGQEVRTLHEDARDALAVERDLDDRGGGLALAGVVLAHGDESSPGDIEADIGIAVVALGGDRLGLGDPGVQPVQPPIGPIREDDRAAGHGVRPAAVFVDAAADVERGGRHIGDRAVGRPTDENAAASLRGPPLDPVDLVAIDPRLAEPDRIAEQVVDPDGGWPCAEGQYGRLGEFGG